MVVLIKFKQIASDRYQRLFKIRLLTSSYRIIAISNQ